MSKCSRSVPSIMLVVVVYAAAIVGAETALPVSPGGRDTILVIEGRCPTFTWTAVDGARGYELVVYPIPEQVPLRQSPGEPATMIFPQGQPQLRVQLPARAAAWTPSKTRCLAMGGTYAWSVRGIADDGGEWSDAYLFRVSDQPSAAEIAQALEVLRQHLGDERWGKEEDPKTESLSPSGKLSPAPQVARGFAATPAAAGALTSESAAFRAEADGTVHAVVGITNQAGGAGLLGENTATGGADLILKGDGSSSPDAAISESGIHFDSVSPVPFDIANASGEIVLTIDSQPVVTVETDQDTLAALEPCEGGQIPRWSGAAWECAADDNDDTLGELSCSSEQIAKWNGSAWACAADTGTGADTLASLACFDGEVAKWTGTAWQCSADIDTDTNTDALTELSCTNGQVAKWTGTAWQCGADVDTDGDTLGDLLCANGQIAKRSGTTWLCGADVDTDTDTLGDLLCANGQIAKWNGTAWLCGADVDTDTDTLGDLLCANGQVPKWSGTTWQCGADVDTDTDTDTDTLGDLLCANGQVPKWSGTTWQCGADVDTDTDTDTLSDLTCENGQVAKWNGTAWLCGADVDTDTDTLGDLPCANGQIAKRSGTTWLCGADVDTDTDTLGDLLCANGQVPKWSGTAWLCGADVDTDSDTLGDLLCANGQVAKWTGTTWACAQDVDTDTDTDTLGGLNCGTDEIAKWNGNAWICAADLAGGGGSPVLAFTSLETPPAGGGKILSLPITAPPGGCTLVVNAVGAVLFDDLQQQDDFDDPMCALRLDDPSGEGAALPGSSQRVSVDIFVRYDQCASSATVALSAGAHTVDYWMDVDTDPDELSDPARPGPAHIWAVCFS